MNKKNFNASILFYYLNLIKFENNHKENFFNVFYSDNSIVNELYIKYSGDLNNSIDIKNFFNECLNFSNNFNFIYILDLILSNKISKINHLNRFNRYNYNNNKFIELENEFLNKFPNINLLPTVYSKYNLFELMIKDDDLLSLSINKIPEINNTSIFNYLDIISKHINTLNSDKKNDFILNFHNKFLDLNLNFIPLDIENLNNYIKIFNIFLRTGKNNEEFILKFFDKILFPYIDKNKNSFHIFLKNIKNKNIHEKVNNFYKDKILNDTNEFIKLDLNENYSINFNLDINSILPYIPKSNISKSMLQTYNSAVCSMLCNLVVFFIKKENITSSIFINYENTISVKTLDEFIQLKNTVKIIQSDITSHVKDFIELIFNKNLNNEQETELYNKIYSFHFNNKLLTSLSDINIKKDLKLKKL